MLYLKFVTDWFIPKRFGAVTIAFIILIRPKYKNDIGLFEHEKVHVHQFWRSLGLFGLMYRFSKKKRLQYEVEAYRKQLEYETNKKASKKIFADFIANNYNLNITSKEALKLLD